jgi:helix-turn-helix protein
MLDSLDDLLTQPEYAKIRRCSERTVERERATGSGCRYVKIGRAVRYRRRDILEFIEKHVRQSTSESAQPVAAPDTTAHGSRPPERNRGSRQNGSNGTLITASHAECSRGVTAFRAATVPPGARR